MGMIQSFKEAGEIVKYKELLKNLVSRDVKKRYKRSALGFLWVMLDPLLMMLIFYLLFSGIFGASTGNYAAYIMSGITLWQLFAQGTKTSGGVFLQSRNLLNKVYLPKAIFPLAVVVCSVVHFIFSLAPLFVIIILSGTKLSYDILLLPFVLCLVFVFSLGISLTVSTLSVFFHDVNYIYDVFLMAWMYLTPIYYPVSVLPERFRPIMLLNPFYHYTSLFRACLYDGTITKTEHFVIGTLFSAGSFLLGWFIYQRNKDRLIYYL
jgi:ABC-type polysaccharide/polyol phosphate export permease